MGQVVMQVKKVEEAGYSSALRGLSFNKKRTVEEMEKVSKKLASIGHGHNKFLESMIVWLEVKGPRYWWQEADTYRISTKQSESTMHTLTQELVNVAMDDGEAVASYIKENFEDGACSVDLLKDIRIAAQGSDLIEVKRRLPEGFLQRRLWCMSYKTLANIIIQRRRHRLVHWRSFIEQVLAQVDHPELLPPLEMTKK